MDEIDKNIEKSKVEIEKIKRLNQVKELNSQVEFIESKLNLNSEKIINSLLSAIHTPKERTWEELYILKGNVDYHFHTPAKSCRFDYVLTDSIEPSLEEINKSIYTPISMKEEYINYNAIGRLLPKERPAYFYLEDEDVSAAIGRLHVAISDFSSKINDTLTKFKLKIFIYIDITDCSTDYESRPTRYKVGICFIRTNKAKEVIELEDKNTSTQNKKTCDKITKKESPETRKIKLILISTAAFIIISITTIATILIL